MAIDILCETILTPTEATAILPRRRAGKRPNVATVYRWIQRGIRGVRLESARFGGGLVTSREALARFVDRLTGAPAVEPAPAPSRAAERAAAELKKLGI